MSTDCSSEVLAQGTPKDPDETCTENICDSLVELSISSGGCKKAKIYLDIYVNFIDKNKDNKMRTQNHHGVLFDVDGLLNTDFLVHPHKGESVKSVTIPKNKIICDCYDD